MLINNVEFAKANRSIEQEIDISQLNRTKSLLDGLTGKLSVKLSGKVLDKPVLSVSIYGRISTLCQNCLEPVEIVIDYNGIVPIFKNESELDEALFGENASSHDGILADDQFNVLDFIEDEVIMLLPLAPKHETCNPVSFTNEGEKPFGILKKLIN